ncbi:TraR/DksA family transcriptional regulator [Roseococcus microcysteis]|uniref:TraR/DksA family transcriptional regulator n=1 Tax=Roseococcus microcysteis TaxID=2771361 RepID=UPI00168AC931|nr:TraR/DksA family transcriptional regulator [Roseococcus microcysteis]
MPDEADLAADRESVWLARTIEAHRPRPQPGRLLCEDCEEPIPELRRQALPSATRCIRCQSALENRNA